MTTLEEPDGPVRVAKQKPFAAVVAARLRHLREHRGMTRAQLQEAAEALNLPLPRNVILNLEMSRREDVTVDELMTLAKVFNREPIWFLSNLPMCPNCQDDPPQGFECTKCYRRWNSEPGPF